MYSIVASIVTHGSNSRLIYHKQNNFNTNNPLPFIQCES